jgi:PAS domain S-box-containing protein
MEIKLLKETLKKERKEQKEARHVLEKKNIDLLQLIDKISLENESLIIANRELTSKNAENLKQAATLAFAKKELIFKDELTSYQLKMEQLALDLTRLIETTNAPIFGIDDNGLVNEWNKSSEKITGFKKHEVIGKKFIKNYITKEFQKAVKKVLDQALIGKETANYEFPIYNKNGARNMILLNSTSRRDKKGNIIGVLGVGQDITQIDKLRTTLEDSAFRLKLVMESLSEVIWGRSLPDCALQYVSSSVVSLFGFPVADWYTNMHLWSDMIHPDDIKRVNKENEVLFNSGTCEMEFRILTANKEIKYINSKVLIIKRTDGTPFFMTGISRDITEQKKDKEQLKYLNNTLIKKSNKLQISNSKLKEDITEIHKLRTASESIAKELIQFIDTANAPIFGIDNKGLVNEWNQTSEKITGFTKDEVLGKDLVQTYITKDYQAVVKKVLDDALLGKETANYEFPLFAKDGTRVMVLLNSSTRRDANGKITGVLGVGQDITQIDTLRTASESIAKELRQFIETANTPIFGIDNKGLVNEWNQTSEKITGFTKAEVLGKDLVQNYITKKHQEAVKNILDDALIGKETTNYEYLLYTKDGARVMVLLNTTTRRDYKSNIIGVLAVGQNITELATYRNELELQVKQRTLKLNDALEEQKNLTELKSQFISSTSHEFRTPLAAINFAAGFLRKYWAKMEPIMVKQKLKRIEVQVLQMTKLLDDVLTIGKVEKTKKNQPLNLGDFICEIIDEVDDSFERSHEIVLIDILELKNSTIFIDKKLGRSIFINILNNAIKFSPNAKKIIIELSSEKSYTVVSVTDFGIGIPKAELKNIFNPFTRAENVYLINGTGLGLSIVKKTLNIIGGKVTVNSRIGHGTTFIIKIPKI